ncbi:SDR family oxidoreductase [Prochlorococcus sp. MIT 1307]|uniref:dTDP-4-dehydrorhamnose reductase family protein n=1 Tax=Prochlorococcus sp. MIT 1307 TaxID=3096219 RepID=UPI002A7656EC|nr:SDR family oxidoreductase [Prochlorococcus sp. MIT 1307]
MKKVLILGAYGLLGHNLSFYLDRNCFNVHRQGRKRTSDYCCDPNIKNQLKELIGQINPDCIVNLIANTNVDNCERDYREAFKTNYKIVENINACIINRETRLIHMSTDQVYCGNGPHQEEDANPINIYGISKYMSEIIADKSRSIIIRTNFVGKSDSPQRQSFSDWAISSYIQQKSMLLFNDVLFNPIHISFLSKVISELINSKYCGLYNLSSNGGISKADFIKSLTNRLGIRNPNATYASIDNLKLPAKRPKDMRLNPKKIEQRLNFIAPTIEETIDSVAKDYENRL